MAVTENMLVDIKIKTDDATKEVEKLNSKLVDAAESSDDAKNTISILQREIAKLVPVIKLVANEFMRSLPSTAMAFKNVDISMAGANNSLNNYTNTTKKASLGMKILNAVNLTGTGIFYGLGVAVKTVTVSLSSILAAFNSLVYVFNLLITPRNIKLLADMVAVLAALAATKGMFSLSTTLSETSKRLEEASVSLEIMKEKSSVVFDEIVGKAKNLNANLAVLGNAWDTTKFAGVLGVAHIALNKYSMSYGETIGKLKLSFGSIGDTFRKTSEVIGKNVTKWGILEAVSIAAPALVLLGNSMQKAESTIVQGAGNIIKWIGVATMGVTGLIGMFTAWIGGKFVEFGEKLTKSVEASMEKFIKFQAVMAQFEFTLRGFAKTFGSDVVGAVGQWEQMMERIYSSTVFTREEIAKSIKLLVAEGQVIGLTFEQNSKLLERNADIAAASGRDLFEVTQMVVNGLTNNADAVLSLGIDIRNTSLAHSDYAEAAEIAIEQMNAQELAMTRLAGLYEKTIPIIGAATNQTKTIAGYNLIYQKTLDDITRKLGETGTATELYYTTVIRVAKFFAELPTPIISLIGNIKDLTGVFFILLGNMIKISAIAFTIVALFKAFNFLLQVTVGLTVSLTGVFGFLARVVAPTIIVFLAVKEALDELYGTSEAFASTVKDIGKTFGFFKNEIKEAKEEASLFSTIISKTWSIAVNAIKVVIIGLTQAINQFGVVFLKIKKLFTNDKEKIDYYDNSVQELETRIAGLTRESDKAYKVLNIFGSGVALASEKTSVMAKELDNSSSMTQKFRERVIKLAEKINEGFDLNIERQRLLGNEFEKAISTYKQAQNELESVFKTKSNEKETAQKYADAEKKIIQASLEIDKLRLDTLKKINEQRKSLESEILRSQGKNIEAINREKIENLKAIDEQIAGLKLLANFKQEDLKTLEETRKLIEKSSDIKVGEERSKSLQKAIEAEKLLADLKRENARLDKNIVDDLKGRVEGRSQEIKKMEEALRLSNDLYGRSKQAIAESKAQVDKMFDTGLARVQMDLLTELNTKRQEMQDNVNKETLTQFENINLAYEKEKELLDIKRQQYETQGLMNESMKAQFGQMDELLKQQKDLQLKKAPGKESEALEKTGSNIAGSIASTFSTGAMGMVTGAMGMVSAIADIVDKILDFVPQFINKIAGIFDKITNLPKVLLDAVKNLSRAAVDMVKNSLPNLIKFLPDIIDELVTMLFEKLPDAFMSLIDSLPDLINKFMERMPELLERIITGLIESSPRIMVSMIKAHIALLPVLWKESYKFILKIPKIIVNGIVDGLKGVGNLFKGISIKGPNIKKTIEGLKLGMKAATKTLTGEASKLFQVMDLGASDTTKETLKDIPGNIEKGAKKAVDYLTMWWRKLIKELQAVWDGIVSVWRNLWDGIKVIWSEFIRAGKAVVEFLKNVWDVVISLLKNLWAALAAVWDTVISALKSAWDTITTAVKSLWDGIVASLKGVFDFLKSVWDEVWQFFDKNIIQPISKVFSSISDVFFKAIDGFRDVFDFFMKGITFIVSIFKGVAELLKPIADVFGKVFGGITDIFSAVDWSSIGTKMGEAFTSVFDGVKGFFSKFYNTLADLINAMKIPAFEYGVSILGKKYSGKLWNEIDLVPGNIAYLADGGFIPRGTDTIPAMLSPGEFVLNKNATQGLGLNFLNNLNRGGGQTSQPNITLNIQIETTQPIDETFFRNNLMPRIKDDIRRRTLNGEFIISSKGVR